MIKRPPTKGSFKKGHKVNLGRKGSRSGSWKGGKEVYYKKQKEYLRNIRKSTIGALGGKCIVCGFSDQRALQIDHINGGGSQERKERNYMGNFHKHVLRSFLNNENKYQILCANCNWIKRFTNNE